MPATRIPPPPATAPPAEHAWYSLATMRHAEALGFLLAQPEPAPVEAAAAALLMLAGTPTHDPLFRASDALIQQLLQRHPDALSPDAMVASLGVPLRSLASLALCSIPVVAVPATRQRLDILAAAPPQDQCTIPVFNPALQASAAEAFIAMAPASPVFRMPPMPGLADRLARCMVQVSPRPSSVAALLALCAAMPPLGEASANRPRGPIVLDFLATLHPRIAAQVMALPRGAQSAAAATLAMATPLVGWLGAQINATDTYIFRKVVDSQGGVFGALAAACQAAGSPLPDLSQAPGPWLLSVLSAAQSTLADHPPVLHALTGGELHAAALGSLTARAECERPCTPTAVAYAAAFVASHPPGPRVERIDAGSKVMAAALCTDWTTPSPARAFVEQWLADLPGRPDAHAVAATAWLLHLRTSSQPRLHPLSVLAASGLAIPPGLEGLFTPPAPGTRPNQLARAVTVDEHALLQVQADAYALAPPASSGRLRRRS